MQTEILRKISAVFAVVNVKRKHRQLLVAIIVQDKELLFRWSMASIATISISSLHEHEMLLIIIRMNEMSFSSIDTPG